MKLFDCVTEVQRTIVPTYSETEIVHVARHRERTSDFAPIRCSDTDGIAFPGYIYKAVPTCPDCLAIVAPQRADQTATGA